MPDRCQVYPMMMKREVWAEFGDGSVATYRVKEEEFLGLVNQLRGSGLTCTIWVDGRLWTKYDRPECSDDIEPTEHLVR